ncbi:unnamed protein product [Paramecium primaurelia]|uniref:Transmembrane protein n=1 Tax=Paramecium primaurelia TaxID=5886 RepID=A0A8S1K2V9_PARPR|nr:unnamed protein product [Paramecium primaurelia]
MNIIQELEIDQERQEEKKQMSFDDSDIEYNYFKIPPNLEKAQLHRQAYTVQKEYFQNSQQCLCCNFHKDNIKYSFFEGRKYYHHHSSLGEYFELIKYCIYQLLIIGIFLVPYCSIIHSQGNQCEKILDCDENTNKIYSVWNLIPKYKSLDNQNYSYFVHLTFILLQILHLRFFSNHKTTKRIQTPAMFEYLKYTCLYFPKFIHQDIMKYMKSQQHNLFVYRVFDEKKYEDSLLKELKYKYSQKYDNDPKWTKKVLMKLIQDNTLINDCIIGKIVLMDKLAFIKNELFMLCNLYNQQVQEYQYQDTQKKETKAFWFIFFNLLFSYYLPRVLITLTMFFRLKTITIYFEGDDLKIIQVLHKYQYQNQVIMFVEMDHQWCINLYSFIWTFYTMDQLL